MLHSSASVAMTCAISVFCLSMICVAISNYRADPLRAARAGKTTCSFQLLLGNAEARVANRDNVSLDRCVCRVRGHAGCHETLIYRSTTGSIITPPCRKQAQAHSTHARALACFTAQDRHTRRQFAANNWQAGVAHASRRRRHVQKLPFALFELSPPVAKMIAPRLRIG